MWVETGGEPGPAQEVFQRRRRGEQALPEGHEGDFATTGGCLYDEWQGSCSEDMGNIGNYRDYMNNSAHLAVSGRVRKAKAQKRTRGRPRKTGAQGRHE